MDEDYDLSKSGEVQKPDENTRAKIKLANQRIQEKLNKESMNNAIKEGSAFSVMSSFGQNYVSAFAIALQASNTQLSLLNSLPGLLTNSFQHLGIKLAEYFHSRKKIIVITVFLQAFTWLPLFILPLIFREYSFMFLITFLILFNLLGALHQSIWSSMMTDIVTSDFRGRYFGLRNKVIGGVAFVAEIIGGIILFIFEDINIWIGFGILFTMACIARLVSYHYMKKIVEPVFSPEEQKHFTLPQFIKSLKETNYGKFVVATSFLRFTVNIASPFFSAFILRDLGFSYLQYTLITAASTIASFMSMHYWGKYSDKYGHKRIAGITSWLIPLIPLGWAFTTNWYMIILIQVLSGISWAGFQLAESNYIYDSISPKIRSRGVAYANSMRNGMVFIGSILGGFLANYLPPLSFQASNLQLVFLISAVLRVIAIVIYLPMFRELHQTPDGKKDHELFVELVAVRPISGLIFKAVRHVDTVTKLVKKNKHDDDGIKVKDKVTIKIKDNPPLNPSLKIYK